MDKQLYQFQTWMYVKSAEPAMVHLIFTLQKYAYYKFMNMFLTIFRYLISWLCKICFNMEFVYKMVNFTYHEIFTQHSIFLIYHLCLFDMLDDLMSYPNNNRVKIT
jgi:hypothetical protein